MAETLGAKCQGIGLSVKYDAAMFIKQRPSKLRNFMNENDE
jgi:hypothetical protein